MTAREEETMSEFTPTTDDARDGCSRARYYLDRAAARQALAEEEYDRWLAQIVREATTKALSDGKPIPQWPRRVDAPRNATPEGDEK